MNDVEYVGYRLPVGGAGQRGTPYVIRVTERAGGFLRELLPMRHDLRNHSPDGFEWGYGGSGPAQLALALACDVLGEDLAATEVYQLLKIRVVAGLPMDGWRLTRAYLVGVLNDLMDRRR